MRIDKYLWCVRLFKTRALASESLRNERVLIDDVAAKPSREVKMGESFILKRHGYEEQYAVVDIPKSRVSAKLVSNYLANNTRQEELDKKEFLQMAKNLGRARGLGRPTKKDRRDLDEMGL